MYSDNVIVVKSKNFAITIIHIYKFLTELFGKNENKKGIFYQSNY